jgi:type IV secretion system protein VirD4
VNTARKPPRFPPAGEDSHLLETLALAALGAFAATATTLWLTGEVSGRLFSGTWPAVPANELGAILARFPSHALDPAEAWPTRQRRLIPGPVTFYATLAALLSPIAALGFVLLKRRLGASARGKTAARWARPNDLRALQVRANAPGRLTLGLVDGRLVAAEPRQSAIVIGPVQTGKTSGFAIPAILEWRGPVLATSVKTDLMRETLAARSALPGAEVWVYDPTGGTGIPSAGWTPLAGCDTWRGAQRRAAWLVAAAHRDSTGIESAEFWYATAAKLLAPILFAAAGSERTMADVVRWVDSQEEEEVRWALEQTDEQAALVAFEASTLRDERTRSSVYTTAETVLAAYADPGVLASALTSELRAERLLDGGRHTAYLCAPSHEQRRLQPLFATLVQEIVACAYERATETGKPIDLPLLIVLDECANIAPLRELATLASTGAGQGIQLVSVFQDMAQISAVYGNDRAPTIVSNHRAKVILSGIADAQTLDYVARLLGDEEVRQISSTSGGGGQHSRTDSVAYRSLAPANVLREMRPGHGLLVYGHIPPARITLRSSFKDRHLRKLAKEVVA